MSLTINFGNVIRGISAQLQATAARNAQSGVAQPVKLPMAPDQFQPAAPGVARTGEGRVGSRLRSAGESPCVRRASSAITLRHAGHSSAWRVTDCTSSGESRPSASAERTSSEGQPIF